MKTLLPCTFMALILLTGCVDRTKTDAQLSKACLAGAALFLEKGYEVKEIKKSAFKESAEFGTGYREAVLSVVESDGWVDTDKEYRCVFAEEVGFMGSPYYAVIYQLNVGDQIYGNKDGQLLGDPETIINMTAAVEAAIRE